MNDIDTINPCALSDQEIVTVGPALNKLFNLAGIAFLLTCLVYLVMHCLERRTTTIRGMFRESVWQEMDFPRLRLSQNSENSRSVGTRRALSA